MVAKMSADARVTDNWDWAFDSFIVLKHHFYCIFYIIGCATIYIGCFSLLISMWAFLLYIAHVNLRLNGTCKSL